MSTSDESGKILLPEGSSICQYRPDISAIIVNKQSRARLLLAHPVSVHFKNKKNVLYILKTIISKSTKKRYRQRTATCTLSESGSGNATWLV